MFTINCTKVLRLGCTGGKSHWGTTILWHRIELLILVRVHPKSEHTCTSKTGSVSIELLKLRHTDNLPALWEHVDLLWVSYLTTWTVVQRPFWPICPGRRGLFEGGPTSSEGYSLAQSSRLPLKCWRPVGARPEGWVLPEVGPPPWALPLPSPSGSGYLCCSLQKHKKKTRG